MQVTPAAAPSQIAPALTTRQQAVLEAIVALIAEQGMPPTRSELAKRMGFTVNASEHYIQLLAKKGALEKIGKKNPRGIRILRKV
jgi:repressor LexA